MKKAKKVIRRLYTSNVVRLPVKIRGKYKIMTLCKGGLIGGGMVMEFNGDEYSVESAMKEWRNSMRKHPRAITITTTRYQNRKLKISIYDKDRHRPSGA